MQRSIELLEAECFDFLVVGAGMHGAWIALRAAQAGYRVALIEKADFGAGTSGNSLNILHGGLRYLQHLDFGRMRSSIRARREFARAFPHLTRPLPCLMALRAFGIRSPWVLGPGLMVNDLLSIDRNSGVDPLARLPMGRLAAAAACRDRIAPLMESDAAAGAIWWDLLAQDSARLVLEVVQEAAANEAVVANGVQAHAYLMGNARVAGVAASDCLGGRELEIRADVVINATGPWAGNLSRSSRLSAPFMPRGWCAGLNLVLRRSLGIETAVALSAASRSLDQPAILQRKNRELFFVPWRDLTMVGTDYLPIEGWPEEPAGPSVATVNAFLAEIARIAPRAHIAPDDVGMTHWGVLPTEEAGSLMPRRSAIVAAGRHEAGADGLVVAIGEKLTSAPVLSEKVLRLAMGQRLRRASQGGGRPRAMKPQRASDPLTTGSGVPEAVAIRLMARYGTSWPDVARHAESEPGLLQHVQPGSQVLGVEVVHAIRQEMALQLDDLVLRRLGIGAAGSPAPEVLAGCLAIAAREWQWSDAKAERAVRDLENWYAARKGTVVRAT